MGRRVLAIVLLVVAISIAIMTPVLAFTPIGRGLLHTFAAATATATPLPTPLPPTPTPTPPKPVLTVVGAAPALHVGAAYLLDDDTGHTLDDFHGEVPLPMASTTKIMTAVIAIQAGNLDQEITIKQDAINEVNNNNGSSAQLKVGDQITLKDLLYGLLLPSGDDAAIAIADGISGNTQSFVKVMNIFAYRLHLFQTHYINSDGLTYYDASNRPVPGNYTTAYDLVRLAQYAMKLPLFAEIVKSNEFNLAPSAHHHGYTWQTINALLTYVKETPTVKVYPGATGIKTGYTVEAGGCLVFSATRNGHDLIGVVLGSADRTSRFLDAVTLLNWGFGLPLKVTSG
ncbi:MAG TPA: D-alanyl-D-alanine carboxypeptidase [Ktedonobacter sp.]|jgi:serine-type D-Ala-D-Ala carboxypeptidase (penicillin-binding protein 5/6)|nr:D-alanyl-D-alanine carboxypeptidase [Ktedonobacter sp.]HAG97960.1 D-alanyl-D-alanine carboxypeptidase [Ktedonobacter sp.]HAT46388.1 D-alanyl-D-alanine carboxypeptidase [Ktedonobacter sp.]HBE24571.1 D-alanyl-D-alanine carboxypeptidase [Ktedonobacter sp.]HCF85557.1 D-alanyl-D-alanine carboxypeptidase [Ktedonobacter sp.]